MRKQRYNYSLWKITPVALPRGLLAVHDAGCDCIHIDEHGDGHVIGLVDMTIRTRKVRQFRWRHLPHHQFRAPGRANRAGRMPALPATAITPDMTGIGWDASGTFCGSGYRVQ
ncbi:MAG: hypothetical protein ACHQRJ_10425 [Alphaproteobacteria bacterium]